MHEDYSSLVVVELTRRILYGSLSLITLYTHMYIQVYNFIPRRDTNFCHFGQNV